MIGVLPPDEVIELLAPRLRPLEATIAGRGRRAWPGSRQDLPRIFLIEAEYELAMRRGRGGLGARAAGGARRGTLPGLAPWRRLPRHRPRSARVRDRTGGRRTRLTERPRRVRQHHRRGLNLDTDPRGRTRRTRLQHARIARSSVPPRGTGRDHGPRTPSRRTTSSRPTRAASRRWTGCRLTVEPGEVLGLLGPNGAGKSTTVKILTTLARPDSGTATVAGHDVLRHPDRVRRVDRRGRRSAPAPTRPPPAGTTCCCRAGSTGCSGARLRRRVDELLERFGLADAAGRPVAHLLRRHAAPARRGARPGAPPEVLFLDEPTTGLDPEARAALWDGDRPARRRRRADHPAHHPLPGGGRPARRPARHRRPGPDRRRGHPRRAQGRTARRRRARRAARSPTARPRARAALGRPAGRARGRRRRPARCSARADDGAAAVPGVLAALERAGVRSPPRPSPGPSLDDVYLRYAGRRFAEAERRSRPRPRRRCPMSTA